MAHDTLANCTCYVQTLDPAAKFGTRWGAHNPTCPVYRESGDYLDKIRDGEHRALLDPAYQCVHYGDPCDNERFCGTCGAGPLRQGFTVGEGDGYGCDAHVPPGFEYTDDDDCQDYWTEWEKEGNDCDCPVGCPCYTDGDQGEYTIAVTVNVERQYTVSARDAAQALAKYQAGQAALDDGRSEMDDWEEQNQTAHTLYPDGHAIAWPAGNPRPTGPPTYTPTDADDTADQARLAALDTYPAVTNCRSCGKLFEPDRHGDDICADC